MKSPTTGHELPEYGTEAWWTHITGLLANLKVNHPEHYEKLLDQSPLLPADLMRRLDRYLQEPNPDRDTTNCSSGRSRWSSEAYK